MKNKKEYQFIASSNVVRYMIDNKAADVLAVLMYKKAHWEQQGKLYNYKGRDGFYISHLDISEETCFGIGTIKGSIELLKKAGLVETAQQGLSKPNVYFLDEQKIKKYIKDHEADYEKGRLLIRNKKQSKKPKDAGKEKNQLSGQEETSVQDVAKTATTKNKNTKNKITKKITNHIPADNDNSLNMDVDSLEVFVKEIQDNCDDLDIKTKVEALFSFLIDSIPIFKGFEMSKEDFRLMEEISDYKNYSYIIAEKIKKNAESIHNNKKAIRFGNLFVGLKNMNEELENKYDL